MIRQYEIQKEHKAEGMFGVAHLKRIHRYLFQDVYPFAGKFRREDIVKGNTVFYKSEYIEENIERLLSELKKDYDPLAKCIHHTIE
ncbi:MAG: Fic family protein [Eubacteriales bacterium]|nr:Fic family protein [Eubacteriales bacterium]MDD3350260.1 Fic family protein [Eubacteriales bacterium]